MSEHVDAEEACALLEAEVKRLREDLALESESRGRWAARAEDAEAEVERLRGDLDRLRAVAGQYLDTGRGDLDGMLDALAGQENP
jgi:hypothetical protein